ncbi:hypothetical protein [Pseudomonas koreensis]|uniref:hypothetical protein n=1 Tax=Pseudomonas koreensis TaxID=198620 RepID=UPI003208BF31
MSIFFNYIISYKSGNVEFYNEFGVITKLVSPSGNYLDFDYGKNTSSVYKLIHSVGDGSGNKLLIDYGTDSKEQVITVTQVVAGETSITKVYQEASPNTNIIREISLPNNFDKRIRFEYIGKKNDLIYLSKITMPTGKVEAFRYKYINYTATQELAVVGEVEIMGDDPTHSGYSQVFYHYSNENFTGYPHLNDPISNRDNCIYRTDDFNYAVTEEHSDIKIKRTFNRFHLIVSEDVIDSLTDQRQSLDIFTYPIVENKDIYEQPENYSFWTRKTTIHTNLSNPPRETYETRSFDKFGNLLSHRDVSGITTDNIYYPPTASSIEEHRYLPFKYFACHLIRSEITPPFTRNGEGPKISEFKYVELRGLSYYSPFPDAKQDLITPYMMRPVATRKNGILFSIVDYLEDNGAVPPDLRIFIGMPLQETLGSNLNAYIIAYKYSKVNALAKIYARHSSGNLEKSTSKTFSLATGLTHTTENFSGAKTEYKYDVENRLISEIKFSETNSPQEENYTYEYYKKIDDFYGYQNTVNFTDSRGMLFTSYINFNNQLSYALESFPPHGVQFCVKKLEYFDSGLIASEAEYDYLPAPSGVDIKVANTTSYSYKAREVIRIKHPDGMTSHFKRNKVNNTEDYQVKNGPIYRKLYDDAGNLMYLYIVTMNGRKEVLLLVDEYWRDGFRRLYFIDSATNGHSLFMNDDFDRVSGERVLRTDGTKDGVDIYRYCFDDAIQNMNLPISVVGRTKNNELVVDSRRTYDGFGRLTKQDGIVFTYNQPYHDKPSATYYEADEDEVKSFANFAPSTLFTTEIKKLAYAGDLETRSKYTYDKKNHCLTLAQTYSDDLETSKLEYTYDAKGAVIRTKCTYATGASFVTEKAYSISGSRVTTVTNHLGKLETYHYDYNGQLWVKKYIDLDIVIFATYNDDGTYDSIRIQSATFSGASERVYATLSFNYNEYGIENFRSLEVLKDGKLTFIFDTSSLYDEYGRIVSRQFRNSLNPDDSLDYTFTYLEAYGHLSSSSMKKGSSLPLVTNYNYSGAKRISSIQANNKTIVEYTYSRDMMVGVNDGVGLTQIFSDGRGNISKNAAKGNEARDFEYDIENKMTKCYFNQGVYGYMYDAFGRLSQINKGRECITYVYDGDTVVGEVSGNTKTLYLSFGNIVLGRYIKRGEKVELEIFGTDSSETVRCVMTCYPYGTAVPRVIYHDYSDFGDRQYN